MNMNAEVDRIIWRRDLEEIMRVGAEAVRRWMKSGKLPAPDVSMSRKIKGWRVSTLRKAGINWPA
ncbi:MAG: DUF2921 family protein [Candidatus Accumulibacter sp.]|nr:DUF2921 family protein [Accumulibacter sp.]